MSTAVRGGRPVVAHAVICASIEMTARVVNVSDPPLDLCQDAAATFSILASAVRIRLLWLLAAGEADVGTLATRAGAGVTSTSQHLAKLRLAGLVTVRVEGKRRIYLVDDPHVISLVEQAIDHHADLRRRTTSAGAPTQETAAR